MELFGPDRTVTLCVGRRRAKFQTTFVPFATESEAGENAKSSIVTDFVAAEAGATATAAITAASGRVRRASWAYLNDCPSLAVFPLRRRDRHGRRCARAPA